MATQFVHRHQAKKFHYQFFQLTKFKDLKDEDFEKTLLDYSTFLYSNKLQKKVSSESLNPKKLDIDFNKWEEVEIGFNELNNPNGLFVVKGSKTTDKKILR